MLGKSKICIFLAALLVSLSSFAFSQEKREADQLSNLEAEVQETGSVKKNSGYSIEEYVEGEEEIVDPFVEEILTDPVDLMEITPLKLTLEECIRLSLEHNAKVQAAGYGIDAAEAQLREASIGGWPILNFEYRTAPVPQDIKHALPSFFSGEWAWWNRAKFDVGIPIYSFGKISLAKEMARSGINAAHTYAFQEKNSLVSKIRQLYYGVLLAEEVGRLLKEAHNRLDEEIRKRDGSNENENEEESYSPTDNLKMKVFLYDLEKRLAEARQREQMALEGLRVQMGLAAGTVFTVYSNKLRPVEENLKPFENYLAVAMENRPDVKLLQTGLEVKKNQYILEKRKLIPDVGVGAFFEVGRTLGTLRNVTVTDDFNDPFSFTRAGIGAQISARFDFHGSAARIKKTKSEYYKLNLEQMIAKEGIKLDVRDAYLKARTAMGNLNRSLEAEKAARQLLFLTQSNYDIGVGEQKDIVDALQLVLMTRGRYFESVFDYNSALAQLDEKIGVLPEVAK